jgi:malonate transporter
MLSILSITIPIYLLIAVGYFAVRQGVFERIDMRLFGKLVMNFCLPALLFRSLAQRPLSEIFNGTYLVAYTLGSLLAFWVGRTVARRWLAKSRQHSALLGLGMAASNTGFIGYPIILQLLGPAAAVPLALTMVVENIFVLPLAITLIDHDHTAPASRRAAIRAVFARLIRNPIVMAIPLGAAFAWTQWQLPEPVSKAIGLLAGASSPIALFVIGGSLVGLQVRGMVSEILMVAYGKLIGHPLAVLAVVLVLPELDPVMRVTAVAVAAMPMLSIYPVLAQKQQQEGFCAAVLLVGTLSSFVTISVVLWALHLVPGWAPALGGAH